MEQKICLKSFVPCVKRQEGITLGLFPKLRFKEAVKVNEQQHFFFLMLSEVVCMCVCGCVCVCMCAQARSHPSSLMRIQQFGCLSSSESILGHRSFPNLSESATLVRWTHSFHWVNNNFPFSWTEPTCLYSIMQCLVQRFVRFIWSLEVFGLTCLMEFILANVFKLLFVRLSVFQQLALQPFTVA